MRSLRQDFAHATRVFTAVLVLMSVGEAAHAVRVQRLTLTDVRDQAHSVIVARVLLPETRFEPSTNMVWTDYALEVEEVLLGESPQPPATISFAGGSTAGRDVGITGVPRLKPGHRYVLFLLQEGVPWATPTVGWGQGIFEIVPSLSGQASEALVSYDGELLEATPAGIRRGPRVVHTVEGLELAAPRVPHGSPREAEPVVFDAEGEIVEQRPQAPTPAPTPLAQRSFASLERLRQFVRREIEEDTEGPN